jgi:hypothetical protein
MRGDGRPLKFWASGKTIELEGVFAPAFLRAYRRSLNDLRLFYDDIAEIGNPASADAAFYYVPGIGGTPGQMRFALPAMEHAFGSRIYAKAASLPEFSARVPIWEKYSAENAARKLAELRRDLAMMCRRFHCFVVVCSSNGLYDFLAAASTFPAGELESRVALAWISCAPDQYAESPWEKVFYPLNGLRWGDHRWFAYPNHDALAWLNPEATSSYAWRDGHQSRSFVKRDLESRFDLAGLEWDYVSPRQLGEAAGDVIRQISRPWQGKAEALISAHDGYWQGAPKEQVLATVRRYVPEAHPHFRAGSHIWVANPTNLREIFIRLRSTLRFAERPAPAAAEGRA